MDLVPARRPHELQVVLRTRDHAALYDPSSNSLSMQSSRLPISANPTPQQGALSQVRRPAQRQAIPFYQLDGDGDDLSSTGHVEDIDGDDGLLIPRTPLCQTCLRPWPLSSHIDGAGRQRSLDRDTPAYIAPNYFRLLAQATSVPGSNLPTRPSTPSMGGGSRFGESRDSSRCATPELDLSNSSEARPQRSEASASASGSAKGSQPLQQGTEADGYYKRFFVEIKKLGRGARGTVFLCQHVLNGNKLGRYAIKKIPVGDHAESLLKSLNEVHLMESLHHPHLIHYQHAWIESCQLSAFTPRVPTLHVLMMAANGGSLADWISARSGEAANESPRPSGTASPFPSGRAGGLAGVRSGGVDADSKGTGAGGIAGGRDSPNPGRTRTEKLKAAVRQRRAQREAGQAQAGGTSLPSAAGLPAALPSHLSGAAGMGVGVHLLRDDEIYSLMHDMTSGLGFLHDRGILHLDIKPGNVLLHWDDDSLVPRAMLSDFGSSMLLHDNWTRQRSGHTGTMEYMSPETLRTDPSTGKLSELSSKADIWSLGVILHLLLFFHLPYSQVDDVDVLRDEMLAYRGFSHDARDRSRAAGGPTWRQRPAKLTRLLARLLDLDPARRPGCAEILAVLDSGPDPPGSETTPSESLALFRPQRGSGADWPSPPLSSSALGSDDDGDPTSGEGGRARIPRRISLGPSDNEGRENRALLLATAHPHRSEGRARPELGEHLAALVWRCVRVECDPTTLRVALAGVVCFLKCMNVALPSSSVAVEGGMGSNSGNSGTSTFLLALALMDVVISATPKPLAFDLALTLSLVVVHGAIVYS